MSRWFRFYEEAVNDDKVRGLSSDTLRWQWVKLLVVASKYEGCVPSLKAAALNLGVNESKAAQVVGTLATAGLLDSDPEGYFRAHNWKGRQPIDATAAERQRRKRQKDRDNRDNGTVTTVTVTPLEEEIEKEEDEAQRSITTSSSSNSLLSNSVENVKEKGWTPPKHCAVSGDRKRIYIQKDTPEWEAYSADFRTTHRQEPQPNSSGGKWFLLQGEAA